MLRIGCHLPSSKGYLEMGKHAVALGATTFAFFTRNPRGGKAKPIQKEDVAAFLAYAAEHDLQHLVARTIYHEFVFRRPQHSAVWERYAGR